MKTFLNYLGQLRLYSLADLILLLVAVKTSLPMLCGALLLHVAFLAYLESEHTHGYRRKTPVWVSYIFAVAGLFLFGKIEGFLYLVVSFLYTQKIKNLGAWSPIFRGLQSIFIVAGILGYFSPLVYIVGGVMVLRNLIGDLRDAGKDAREGVKTIPVMLGIKKNMSYIHLYAMFVSSYIWWSVSSLPVYWLLTVFAIEVATYNFTPRNLVH